MYPYSYDSARRYNFDVWGDGSPTKPDDYKDLVAIMNSDQVFEDNIETPSGRLINVSKF